MKNISLLFFILFFTIDFSMAQENTDEKSIELSVSLNSDQFFGFYPFVQGIKPLNDKLNLSFYGIFWSGGTGANWGNWTEFGVGLNFEPMEGLAVTPQLGITGGNLLSSGTSQMGILSDGFVPNLTVKYDSRRLMSEFYTGFYLPLSDNTQNTTETTLSYTHYWLNAGIKSSTYLNLGFHYEHLINSGGSNVEESSDVYQWFGPFLEFSDPKGKHFTRFTFGTDLVEGRDSFFKLTTGFNF